MLLDPVTVLLSYSYCASCLCYCYLRYFNGAALTHITVAVQLYILSILEAEASTLNDFLSSI